MKLTIDDDLLISKTLLRNAPASPPAIARGDVAKVLRGDSSKLLM
jgi:hypothetical protein